MATRYIGVISDDRWYDEIVFAELWRGIGVKTRITDSLLPLQPLKANTTYTVTFSGAQNGTPRFASGMELRYRR